MKNFVFTLILSALSSLLFAQYYQETNIGKNIISLNFHGDMTSLALNYERLFAVNYKFQISGKVGLGYLSENFCFLNFIDPMSWTKSPQRIMAIPLHITGVFGDSRFKGELGFGWTIYPGGANFSGEFTKSAKNSIFYPVIGAKYIPLSKPKMNFRIYGYLPQGEYMNSYRDLYIPIGFSIGVVF